MIKFNFTFLFCLAYFLIQLLEIFKLYASHIIFLLDNTDIMTKKRAE